MSLSFSLKKKVTKEKVAAGFCCYESVVIGQGQWLPQHYQCCIGGGYLSEVTGSGRKEKGTSTTRGGLTETRAMRRLRAAKHFSVLIFWLLLDQAKSS
jgi:hypothetical protein